MRTTGFLTLEAELDCFADELDKRCELYLKFEREGHFAENRSYWRGRRETAQLIAEEIRKLVDDMRPTDG